MIKEKMKRNKHDMLYFSIKYITLFLVLISIIGNVNGMYYISGGGDRELNNGTFNNTFFHLGCEDIRLLWGVNNSNLVSIWDINCYDYDNIIEDVSNISNNDATNSGATFNFSGGVNETGGLEYDGINDYVSSFIDLTDYSEYSVMLWAKRTGIGLKENGESVIIGQDSIGDRVFGLSYGTNANNNQLSSYNGLNVIYGDNIITGEWVHIVATNNATTHAIYQDSVLKDSDVGNIPGASSIFLKFGGRDYVGNEDYTNGTIDEIFIYNRSLSQTEINNIYSSWIENGSIRYKNNGTVSYHNINLTDDLDNITLNKTQLGTVKIYINEVYECNLTDANEFCDPSNIYNGLINSTFEFFEVSTPAVNEIVFGYIISCNCTTCDDCFIKLNNPICIKVWLNNTLSNISGDCIVINNLTSKVFNCNGNFINGTNNLQNGVLVNNSDSISVINCLISNFQNGIKIKDSSTNEIKNNVLCDNWEWDIINWDIISYGENNTATRIYNFQDIGYTNSTTYQCSMFPICESNSSLAVYIGLMIIFIIFGYIFQKNFINIVFIFSLFMLSFYFIDLCKLSFLWFMCVIFSFYYSALLLSQAND